MAKQSSEFSQNSFETLSKEWALAIVVYAANQKNIPVYFTSLSNVFETEFLMSRKILSTAQDMLMDQCILGDEWTRLKGGSQVRTWKILKHAEGFIQTIYDHYHEKVDSMVEKLRVYA